MSRLRYALFVLWLTVLVIGCRASHSVAPATTVPRRVTASPEPTRVEVTDTPTAGSPPTPRPSPMTSSTPARAAAAIVPPGPTARASATGSEMEVATCCGLLAWVDDARLLVYDTRPEAPAGAWLVTLPSGERRFLASRFGLPSPAGIVALPDTPEQRTTVVDLEGSELAVVPTGGALSWPSPDGRWLAWLERLPVRTPSSSVNRVRRLWVAELATGERRALLELQAASLTWLPDSQRLLVAARSPGGEQPGIWLVDVPSGAVDILVRGAFLYNVRLSPDGRRLGYVRAFSGEPGGDGLWILDLASRESWRLPVAAGFRWAGSGDALWLLDPGEGDHPDALVLLDARSGERLRRVSLPGQVLNSVWEVSPNGRWMAFWRLHDQHVVAVELERRASST